MNVNNLQDPVVETPLPTPAELKAILPLSWDVAKAIFSARQTLADIIAGRDPRLLVVVGPCSLHDEASILEYAQRLQPLKDQLGDELFIVMRTYYAKPRTTFGWKGFLYDPQLNASHDLAAGLKATRKILLKLAAILPLACEFLDMVTPNYLSDLISWSAIGARTSASQIHRELASGLDLPVGFKNSVDGNIQVAIAGIMAASIDHHYLGFGRNGQPTAIHTHGNGQCHLILRGGLLTSNYSMADIKGAVHALIQHNLSPRLMIDCSHDNSGKEPQAQMQVVKELIHLLPLLKQEFKTFPLLGLMLESHLVGGSQSLEDPATLTYGQSITDPCLSWTQTQSTLEKLATALRTR